MRPSGVQISAQPQPQMRMTAEEYRRAYAEPERKPTPAAPILPRDESKYTLGTRGNLPTVEEKVAPPPQKAPAAPTRETPVERTPEERAAPAPRPEQTPPATPTATTPKAPEPPAQEAAPEKSFAETETPTVPDYRIVGEVFHSYVIVETGDKMLLIDKPAAHERILFEQLKAGLAAQEVVSQMLMLPVDVMMTSAEVEALKEYAEELEKIGFSLRFARNTVSADAIPETVDPAAVSDMLGSMAARILNSTGGVKLTRDILFEKALYQAACKAAIKAGRAYADGHIKWLVDRLMTIPDITFCPHGRPVALELSHHTLDKQFDRTGF